MKYEHSGNTHTLHFSHNVLAFLYIVLGIVLLVKPSELTRLFCVFVGIAALLYGGVRLFSYLHRKESESAFQTDLILGVILLVIGIICLVRRGSSSPFSHLFWELSYCWMRSTSSSALSAFGTFLRQMVGSLILALLLALLGITLIANPFETTILFVQFLGFTLLADGCFDLWGNYQYRKYL